MHYAASVHNSAIVHIPKRPRITPNSAAIVRNTLRAPALRYRDFRLLVAASFFDSIGFMGEQVVVGWLVLEITDDPFMVGIALGLRFAPFFFLGLVAGTIADMVDRRSLIRALNLAMTAVTCSVGALIYYDTLQVWHIFAFAVLGGCISALHQTSRQSFAFDVVGRQNLVSGLAYVSLGMRLGGLVGSLAAGYLIAGRGADLVYWLMEWLMEAAQSRNWLMEAVGLDRLLNAAQSWDWLNSALTWIASALSQGAASAYFLLAAGYLISVVMLSFIRSRGQAAPTQRRSALQNLREFAVELRRNNALLMLMVIVAATEVLGFSSATAFPSLARDVLNVGADGLGEMNAVRSLGAVLTIALLAVFGEVGRKGALLLATIVAFGAALILLGQSGMYAVALAAIMVIGGAMALSDVFSQSLMQNIVPNEQRGRAMGAWVVGIGTAPLGSLQVGAAVAALGVGIALTANGIALVAIAAAIALLYSRMRRL